MGEVGLVNSTRVIVVLPFHQQKNVITGSVPIKLVQV